MSKYGSWLFGDSMQEGETANRRPMIQGGRIINVKHISHLYDVITDNGMIMPDIPLMLPYVSNEVGQGINIIPEVGTRCLVVNTVNGEDFIMGFLVPSGTSQEIDKPINSLPKDATEEVLKAKDEATAQKIVSGEQKFAENNLDKIERNATRSRIEQKNTDSYLGRSGRRSSDLLPGDFEFKTSYGSMVRILSDGVVEIIAQDGQCLTQYIPVPGENLIFTLTDILKCDLPAGKLIWESDVINTRAGRLTLEIKSNIDEEADVTIRLGQDKKGTDNRVEVSVGTEFNMAIDNQGEATIKAKEVKFEVDGKIDVECKSVKVNSKGRIKINGSQIDLN
jgi:hypothetical protein